MAECDVYDVKCICETRTDESVIVGMFTILTGKRCSDGRNHSDAEALPVFNRTGEWDRYVRLSATCCQLTGHEL